MLEGPLHSQPTWEGALSSLTPAGGDGSADHPSAEAPFRLVQSAQRGPWPRRSGPRPAARLVFSPRPAEGAAARSTARCAEARTPPPPAPHPTPAPRPRVAGAEKQAWARPRVGNKGAQAERVTHRARTGTRAPGVADPARPGAGLRPSWVSTLSSPRVGGGTISVPWGHAASSELGGHLGPRGLQPHQRTDVRDSHECAE